MKAVIDIEVGQTQEIENVKPASFRSQLTVYSKVSGRKFKTKINKETGKMIVTRLA